MTREIVLDTETTGLNANGGDRIVEIGCVELFNHIPTGKNFHTYVNPLRDMPDGAFKVHGLSEEFLSDKPIFAKVKDEFLEFIADTTLIIHNAPFDMGFLNSELNNVQTAQIKNDVIDTVQLARKKHPGARVGLDALCKHYGIDNSKRTVHGALLDSEILAEVYLELIGGRQVGLALNSTIANDEPVHTATHKAYETRQNPILELSENQKAKHLELLDQLGSKPVWNKYETKE
ncbi:MAG: DNA polymerase III subunit epsilon [Devosiaceae bacterium]|nr:DNA polymerase III subunit epsilon [Devosiaceae bacterium]